MGDEIGRINQQMEIKNIAVNSKCVYLPYGISNHNDGLERMEPVQDGFYRAKGLGIKMTQKILPYMTVLPINSIYKAVL